MMSGYPTNDGLDFLLLVVPTRISFFFSLFRPTRPALPGLFGVVELFDTPVDRLV